jgi:hypothetical protein
VEKGKSRPLMINSNAAKPASLINVLGYAIPECDITFPIYRP